jgi:hypothetical protein
LESPSLLLGSFRIVLSEAVSGDLFDTNVRTQSE